MLTLLAASLVTISIQGQIHVPQLLDQLTRHSDRIFLYRENDPWIERVHFCPAFTVDVPPDRVLGTYKAIFAFFEIWTTPINGTPLFAVHHGSTNHGLRKPWKFVRGRYRVHASVLGGRAVLELAWPLHALSANASYRKTALLKKTRTRLLHSLQGVNAQARAQAAVLLGVFGPKNDAIRRALAEAEKDEDPRVRAAATRALLDPPP